VPREKLLHILIGGLIALVLLLPVGVVGFVKSGIYHVGAAKRHTKLTWWITHETMIHSVRSHARRVDEPAGFGPEQVLAGFCGYETHCAACHGAAAVAREPWAGGMEPSPPYLLDVTKQFRPRETFWIIKNGIKMTGMPAWGASMSDNQLWQIVAWLEVSAKLPPQTYARWRQQRRCVAISPGPLPAPAPPSIPRP
jgi:hypothetical protein